MKRWLGAAILLFAAIAVWWTLSRHRDLASPSHASLQPDTQRSKAATRPVTAEETGHDREPMLPNASPVLSGPVDDKPKPAALAAAEDAPAGPEAGEPGSGLTPLTVLENVRLIFREYHLRFGANPVGDNAEITASLSGRNPRQVNFVKEEDGLRLNDRGELVDNWGTPFFFHQLSRTEMEIHSAGPDRKMWSQDDLVLK